MGTALHHGITFANEEITKGYATSLWRRNWPSPVRSSAGHLFSLPGPDTTLQSGAGLLCAREAASPPPGCYDAVMKVYTKTGDQGSTSLFTGGRVGKDHPRIEAYGTIDELNSFLGLLLTTSLPESAEEQLRAIQSSLFAIGSVLADADGKLEMDRSAWATEPIEAWIDAMDSELDELRAFILPGGSQGAALAHLARTVCRRAERRVLAVDGVAPGIVPYLNRLSDAFFVLARAVNARLGIADPEWRPRG